MFSFDGSLKPHTQYTPNPTENLQIEALFRRGDEFTKKGQVPPINSNFHSQMFRDSGKEAEVTMMASVLVHFATDLQTKLGKDTYNKVIATWRTGMLDSKLLPEVQAMRPDFKLSDLGFLFLTDSEEGKLPDTFEQDEETQAQIHRLAALVRRLKHEQDTMRAHKAVALRCQTQQLASEGEFQRSLSQAVDEAWQDHSVFFQFHECKLQTLQAISTSAHAQIAARQLKETKDVPILSILNLPMLGSTCSSYVDKLTDHVATELTGMASRMMYIVIPPNQPELGSGKLTKLAREKNVLQHQEKWKTALETNKTISLHHARAVYDQQSMYSDDRALGFEIWLVVAESVEADLQTQNVFGSSVLMKRKALPGLVEVLHRSSMANFTKPHTFAEARDTQRDLDVERKQHFSGQAFLSQLISTALQTSRLGAKNTVMIRDETMYDAELARAVMSINSKAAGMPQLAYIGMSWASSSKQTITENVKSSLVEVMKGAISRNEYALAKIPAALLTSNAQKTKTVVPALDLSQFTVTAPQTNLELRWLQSTLDEGELCGSVMLPTSEVWGGLGWKDIKKKHDDEFNPTGMLARKRAADSPADSLLGTNLLNLFVVCLTTLFVIEMS